MRYEVNQELFAVHFNYEPPGQLSHYYSSPYMRFGKREVTGISIIKLLVKEHHKVSWDQDPEGEKKYDGYLLTDEEGAEWVNQYPRASYGQTTTTCDQRFYFHYHDDRYDERVNENKFVECHLLTDWLENVFRFTDKDNLQGGELPLKEELEVLVKQVSDILLQKGYRFEKTIMTFGGGYQTPQVKIVKIEEVG